MNQTSKFSAGHLSQTPFDMTDISAALREQSNAWLDAQSSAADAVQSMMSSWTRWRQEDIQAALRTWQQIASSKDAAGVASADSECIAGVIDRRKRELDSATQEAMRLATIGQQSLRSLSLNEAGRLTATGQAMADPKSTTHDARSASAKAHSEAAKLAAPV